jgi:hypothetical protein
MRRPEIKQFIKLFSSGTAEGRNAAYEMITGGRVGPGEIERPEQRATRYFYTDYASEVLRVGDASDKELAAELLMSIAKASAQDKQSSRINLELWAMVERPLMLYSPPDSAKFFSFPPDRAEEWLLTTSLYAKLKGIDAK